MINLQIEQFKTNFRQIVQQAELPIGIIYYILKNLFQEIETLYYTTLNSLLALQLKLQLQEQLLKILDLEN